ncbi:CoA transferase [Ramlibacter tataouinensis]|uniref:CaiB/BaiF CoA transferase family protein n=1 Tax=Ramlibacter tataouinensis TaxID=94132 RepID=UPI0022F3CA01|nr:CoA transferase [Ramlibacter tataouinensis]WBY01054.1 CoA transferase [Ramlibacter tataouinensis]
MAVSCGPLEGIRVLELGSSVAGPFCGRLFADFGAEVIKVEVAEGDAVRSMGKRVDGKSLYAASIFRNKRLISVDLRTDAGRTLVRQLAEKSDILVENFRPGTLERMGLGYEALSRAHPGLIMVRISGFGQTGPYADRAGYGAIGEALSGLRHLTGDPDRPPSRIAASVTDEITGIYGCMGAMMALWARQRTGQGQVVDATLFESAFSLIEPHVPAYAKLGIVANRAGARLPDSAPNNTYVTRDRRYIHVTAMGDAVFVRLANVIGRPELADDPAYRTQVARSANEETLDGIIGGWIEARPLDEVVRTLNEGGVPCAPIYTVADIFEDEHFKARDMLLDVPDDTLGTVTVAGVVPRLSGTPGRVRHAGGSVGDDTAAVLRDVLGLADEEIERLQSDRIIHAPARARAAQESE